MSDQNWTPGYMNMEDTPLVISPDTEQVFGDYEGGGYGGYILPTYFRMTPNIATKAMSVSSNIETDYRSKLSSLPGQIQSELSSSGATITATNTPTDLATIARDKFIVDRIIQIKNAGLQNSSAEANSFYGGDPHTKSQRDYIETFDSYMRRQRSAGIKTQKHWIKSYTAGYSARLYAESIRLLTQHSNQLTIAYANALAREEAARQTETLAQEIAENDAQNTNLPTSNDTPAYARPLVINPDGLIAGYDALPTSLAGALDALEKALSALGRGQLAALLATAFYSPRLGNGELQRTPVVLTMPLSQLVTGDYADLLTADSISVPYRVTSTVHGEHTQLFLSPTGKDLSDRVRVREAKLDPSTNLYTFRTEGFHPRTLTWTPSNAPGEDALGSTELPEDQPEIKIYPGARVTPVEGRIDEHPARDEIDVDDYALVFPAESGINPVYVMASRSGPRYEPGTATGAGQAVGANWLGNAAEPSGSPIPVNIADGLRGQNFRDFKNFREKFWELVSSDAELANQFSKSNLKLMRKGSAPFPIPAEHVGGRDKFEIHHIMPISEGGAVYDMENLRVTTPKNHIEIHKKGNE
ncbi:MULTISPECIES: S-type pyocin domain-containing protein [unclassified Pseudomonas]|uniref:S-type pyocin domain-containing protein n=1 Tax=unclassified Pseudomonas TaxID=196821 RepID=UPI001CBAC8E6|nr:MULTISPECIES: S-type pyocin domain-containing protein [unclassified Pseudomonas]